MSTTITLDGNVALVLFELLAGGAGAHPERTGAVQSLQRLLLDRFDQDRMDIGAACSFEQSGGVGLVTFDIGAHVARRQ